MKSSDVLRSARARIAGPGDWAHQCTHRLRASALCAACAVVATVEGLIDERPGLADGDWLGLEGAALLALSKAIGEPLPAGYTTPIKAWNCEPGRTQAEVLAAFDRAIADEEASA